MRPSLLATSSLSSRFCRPGRLLSASVSLAAGLRLSSPLLQAGQLFSTPSLPRPLTHCLSAPTPLSELVSLLSAPLLLASLSPSRPPSPSTLETGQPTLLPTLSLSPLLPLTPPSISASPLLFTLGLASQPFPSFPPSLPHLSHFLTPLPFSHSPHLLTSSPPHYLTSIVSLADSSQSVNQSGQYGQSIRSINQASKYSQPIIAIQSS